MPTSKTWPSGIVNVNPATYQIPIAGELNWASLSDFLNAIADGAQSTTFQKFSVRKAETTPVTVQATIDCFVATDMTIPGPVVVDLPAGSDKQVFFIIDGKGDAATNNVTIVANGTDTIRGQPTLVLANNRAAVCLAFNAADTDWKCVGPVLVPGSITPDDIVGVIPPEKGGTGVSNDPLSTITVSGAFPLEFDLTGPTDLVLPTTGTVATLAGVETFTNKSIDGDDNTVTDLALSSLKTVPADANKAIVRDAVGAVVSAFISNANLDPAAAIARSKIANGTPNYVVINSGTGALSEEAALAASRGGLGTNASAFTGVVKAAAGVFSASAVVDADVAAAAAINATKIADGSVDNTEFQRLGTAGTNGAGNLVTTDGTQTLTNKTIDGASNTITNVSLTTGVTGILPIANGGTNAATANAALNNLLPTQTGNAGRVLGTDGTNTSWTAAGSGSGGINLVNSPSTADGWTETGTVFNTPVTTTTAGDLPLTPEVTTAIQFVATGSGTEATNYNSYSFTVPPALGVKMGISLFLRPGTGFAASEWTLSIYTAGGVRQSLSTDSAGVSYLPNTTGQFVSTFDAVAGTSYTLRIARIAGAGSATLNIAEANVGTAPIVQGSVVEPWVSYTPTVTDSSGNLTGYAAGTPIGFWRRSGDTMNVRISVQKSGAPSGAAVGSVIFSLPTGYNMDLTKLTNPSLVSAAGINIGTGESFNILGASQIDRQLVVGRNNNYTNQVSVVKPGSNVFYLGTEFVANAGFFLDFTVPIAEWAGSGTVNLAANAVEFAADDGTADVFGPNGAPVPNTAFSTGTTNRLFSFQTPPQAQDFDSLELNVSGTGWVQASSVFPRVQGNNGNASNAYGVWALWSTPTVFEVTFGNQGTRVNASNADNGASSWATAFAAGTRFRVRKASGGQAVGFGLADTSGNSGLVAPYSTGTGVVYSGTYTPVVANSTNFSALSNTAANYYRIGNLITVTGQFTGTPTAAVFNAVSITLPIARASVNTAASVSGTAVFDRAGSSISIPMSVTYNAVGNAAASASVVYCAAGVGAFTAQVGLVNYSFTYALA